MQKNKTNIIILAAGRIHHKLGSIRITNNCPALLPVQTKPLAGYVIDFYLKSKLENETIYLVINEKDKNDVEKELGHYNSRIEFFGVSETRGVNQTLDFVIQKIPASDYYIVNLVTTIPLEKPKPGEVFIGKEEKKFGNWSSISFENQKPIFFGKNPEKPETSFPFCGVFNFNQKVLLSVLKKFNTPFDLLELIVLGNEGNSLKFKKTDWLDCGHESNYFDTLKKLINARSFNSIRIEDNQVVVKSSEKIDKIKAEYDFIKKVPEDIQVFFPRLINSFEKFSEKRGQYKLEFYGYPNVSELQLYWELAPEVWVRFFEQISFVLERFKAYKYSIGKQANFEFYFTRLESRLRTFRSQLDANDKVRFFSEEIFINGKKTRSLDELLKILKTQINKLYFEDDFCIMHGDLCFNNILFDFRTGIIKLIDPRGSFGEKSPGIYGDQKYDLAKLAHSAIFGYDYLVNKLFELQEVSRNQFEININLRDNHRLLEKNTNELIKKLGYKTDEIYLITSILFLSMVPLHNDDFLKQKAMFLTGLEILGNVLTKND